MNTPSGDCSPLILSNDSMLWSFSTKTPESTPEENSGNTTVRILSQNTISSHTSVAVGQDESTRELCTQSTQSSRGKRQLRVSRSKKAGVQFPVSRFHKQLRKRKFAKRIGNGAAVYITAVIEYCCSEMLDLAGDIAAKNKRKRITPRHLQLAVRSDCELDQLLFNVTIPEGGVVPTTEPNQK